MTNVTVAAMLVSLWEIVLIITVVLFVPVVVAVVLFIVWLTRRSKKGNAPSQPPVIPSATERLPRRCPQCGSQLKADVPEGLCPACLLQHGIATEAGGPAGQPTFVPPSIAELTKLFPQLEIIGPIGKGGMGAVYKARQPALDRFVALKILAPRPGNELDFASRFSREARALARLSHPNIVAVYDFGVVSGVSPENSASGESGHRPDATSARLSYFIMEFVDGPNLRQVQQAGRIAPREALEIIPQICAALQFAHDEGIVHRDIKPENVLLDKKGRVKIADFGLAKILGQEAQDFRLTGARDVMGTPHYMAPEQVEKPQEVDHRADIFSLGVVFYEMLTGELPLGKFQPPSAKVQVDVRLDEVVLRALEKEPGRRYQNVSEVRQRVETIGNSPSQTGGTGASAAGTEKPVSGTNSSFRFGLLSLGLFLGSILGTLFLMVISPRQELALVFGAVALLLAVIFGILGWREKAGRAVVIITGVIFGGLLAIGAITWLIVIPRRVDQARAASEAALTRMQAEVARDERLKTMREVEANPPQVAPGEQPNPSKVLAEAQEFLQRRNYEKSLQRLIWYHQHALEYDPGQSGVRLSLALSEWIELGRRYPKAKQALIEIRDEKTRQLREGRGHSELFQDVESINEHLQDEDATYALFKWLVEKDPQLARQCYFYAESLLVKKGEYQLCLEYMGSPLRRFELIRQGYAMGLESQKRMAETRQGMQELNEKSGRTNAYLPPDHSELMLNSTREGFVTDTRQLIEILVATDRSQDAEDIRQSALTVLGDSRIESAISDAERKLGKTSLATPSADESPSEGLQFRWVARESETNLLADELPDPLDLTGNRKLRVLRTVVLDDSAIAAASASLDSASRPEIRIVLSEAGRRRFAELTGANVSRQLAILWDGRVVTAPRIAARISGSLLTISGSFTRPEADEIVAALNRQAGNESSATRIRMNEVVERTIFAQSTPTNGFFDFETGRTETPSPGLDLRDRPALWRWAQANGVDAMVDLSPNIRGFLAFGRTFARVPDSEWENATPFGIEKILADFRALPGADPMELHAVSGNVVSTDPNRSRTFAFRTREGSLGVLQLLEVADPPNGFVRFRYRFLGRASAAVPDRVMPDDSVARDLNARFAAAREILAFTEKDSAMGALARDAAAAGEVAIVRKALGQMTAFTKRDDATREAARRLAGNGHRAEALELARTITSFTVRDATLRELADQ